jgi:hypothetical protein
VEIEKDSSFALILPRLALLFCALCLSINGCGGKASNPVEESRATPSASGNPANDRFLALTEREQKVQLSATVGEGCVGNRVFYMGTDPNPKYLDFILERRVFEWQKLSSLYRTRREYPSSGLHNLEESRDGLL